MKGYFAIVRRTNDDEYRVEFPDIPGCSSNGGSVDAAFSSAAQALREHAETLESRGKSLPAPRPSHEMVAVAMKHAGVAAACLRAPT